MTNIRLVDYNQEKKDDIFHLSLSLSLSLSHILATRPNSELRASADIESFRRNLDIKQTMHVWLNS